MSFPRLRLGAGLWEGPDGVPEERKLATMLFADIVGSSAIGEARDPEVMRAALGRTFDAVSEVIRSHGGTVEKFIGDAVMAVFGVPTAHDDDAERAVRAAFAVRERMTEFEVRIGINSGEVVADTSRESQFLVTGGAVNAAARLQQAAAPGEIVVGALTRQLTAAGVRYGAARSIQAKGIGTLEAYLAQAVMTAVPQQHRGLPGLRAPLIGREKELRLLHDAIDRTAQDAGPSLITIYGPPGAGKSRLLNELVARIDMPVRTGRCLPYGEGISYYPLQLILRQDAAIDLTDQRSEALAKLSAAVRQAVGPDEAEAVAARVAVLAGLADADALGDVARGDLGEELAWGMRRYLERRAAGGPLVLIFEDVHWAEPTLLDLIEHLAEFAHAPLSLVCLARPDFRELRPTWGSSATNATTITLAPLSGDDTRRLIGELLRIDDLSERVRTEVVARAEGNPLYVEEFLRLLMETGAIEQRDGRWAAAAESRPMDVPATLMALITSRLDRVSPEVKVLLQHGSLAGRLFSTTALSVLADGEPPKPDLLRDAVRRDLLVEVDERALGEGRVFRFKHVLIREVAYSTLPKGERSQLHDRYGRWLEASLADRRGELVDIVAHHAEQAYSLSRELDGADAAALGRRAFDLLLEAARVAEQRDDVPAARSHAERAAAITDRMEIPLAPRIDARARAAVARLGREPTPENLARLDTVVAEARAAGPSRGLAELLLVKAWHMANETGIYNQAVLVQEALAVARAADEPEMVAEALDLSGNLLFWTGDLAASHRVLTEALAYMDERGVSRVHTSSLLWIAFVETERGDFTDARAHASAASSLFDAKRSRHARFEAARVRGRQALREADFGAAAVACRESLGVARELGLASKVGEGCWTLGEALLESGQAAAAAPHLREAIEIFTRRGSFLFLSMVQALSARAAVALGDLAAARAFADSAVETAQADDWTARSLARGVAAEVSEAEGKIDDARRLFGEALAVTPPACGYQIAMTRTAFGQFLLRQGQRAEARVVLEAVRDFYQDPVASRRRAEIDALLRSCDEVPA